MYDLIRVRSLTASVVIAGAVLAAAPGATAQQLQASPELIRKISGTTEKLEITTNSSRILTLGMKIPRVQVNNPELLDVTPLSATEVQIAAKKAGVTQVNLWDEQGKVHTVDVFIYGDVRELQHALATQFPNSSIRVYRYSNALVLAGFIDRPDYVSPIVELAQDYSPKVINNISVGGVQQVLLQVKIFEVSRTKLRKLGVDFAALGGGISQFGTSSAGLLAGIANDATTGLQTVTDTGGQTVQFGVSSNGNALLGFLDALEQNNLAKILAEPNITAVSGRPAQFNEGGEIPIIVPQGFGQVSIEYKKFGTQVDFLPIVLGNGSIRLEVRPRVSELDVTNGITINDIQVPALTVREVDTAVEMKAGQTFALAGLIQRRVTSLNRGIPGLKNMPLLGVPFRTTQEEVNEIELLILVTPEFVDALDPNQAPHCLPGMGTMSPNDTELYRDGIIEVHNRCNECGQFGCVRVHGHEPCCPPGGCFDGGCQTGDCGAAPCESGACGSGACGNGTCGDAACDNGAWGSGAHGPIDVIPAVEVPLPTLGQSAHQGPAVAPTSPSFELPQQQAASIVTPQPTGSSSRLSPPPLSPPTARTPANPPKPAEFSPGTNAPALEAPISLPATPTSPYLAPRKPRFQRQASQPYQPQAAPALIGPLGYDDE